MHTEIGWLGMILFLLGYYLVANKKLDSTGISYNVINVIGAAAIAYSLWPAKAWPTIALECCFIAIGVLAIVKVIKNRRAA